MAPPPTTQTVTAIATVEADDSSETVTGAASCRVGENVALVELGVVATRLSDDGLAIFRHFY